MRIAPAETLPDPNRQDLIQSLHDLGWETLRHAPAPGQPSVEGPLILAHRAHGVALLDLAPDRHDHAPAALRQRLHAAGVEAESLPIIHRVLGPGDGWRLTGILDQAFAEAPPIDAPGPDWIGRVQAALLPVAPPRPSYAARPASRPARRSEAAARQAHPLLLFWGAVAACAVLTIGVLQWLGAPPPEPAMPVEVAAPSLPTPPPGPAVARPAEPVASAPGPVEPALPLPPPAAPPVATPPPEGGVVPRIFVHHVPDSIGPASAVADRAARLGGSVEVRPVPFAPPGRQVRYFRSSDAALAQRLVAALGPGWRLHDLTRFSPQPSPGTLEVWLSAED